MSDEQFKYYTSIQTSITGAELKSIPPKRYDDIEKMAYEDVKAGKRAKPKSDFKTDAEYKSYLLNLVDFAYKIKNGITPELGIE